MTVIEIIKLYGFEEVDYNDSPWPRSVKCYSYNKPDKPRFWIMERDGVIRASLHGQSLMVLEHAYQVSALLASFGISPWLPIETAPKDGSWIQTSRPIDWREKEIKCDYAIVHWREDIDDDRHSSHPMVWGGRKWKFNEWNQPTFWQPLQPKPVEPAYCGLKHTNIRKTLDTYTSELEYDGIKYPITIQNAQVLECEVCGSQSLYDGSFDRLIDDLRQKAKILTPEEIHEHCKKLNISRLRLADELGCSVSRIDRIKTGGQIQNREDDNKLRKLFASYD